MSGTLRQLREDEQATANAERASLAGQALTIVGLTAVLWAAGLVLLVRVQGRPEGRPLHQPLRQPLHRAEDRPLHQAPGVAGVAQPHLVAPAPDRSLDLPDGTPEAPPVDLAAAADVCVAISRLTRSDALPWLLARAAVVLDAPGVIVWMGAGDELFAVTAHGYDPRVVARLGPIGRHANNATAEAWRTGQMTSVAGDMMSNGAVVAPMFGVESCIGVLAAELRHGREADPATRAIATMLAAQLATVVSAWPAHSTATPEPAQFEDRGPLAASV